MTDADFKNLPRRAAADKILHDKAFNITKKFKYDGCQRGLPSRVYKFFDRFRVVLFKIKLCKIKNYLKKYTNQLLEI